MFTRKKFDKYLADTEGLYPFLKKYAKREGKLCGKELIDLTNTPYDVVKNKLPELLKDGLFEEGIHLLLSSNFEDVTIEQVEKETPQQKFLFILWVYDQYELISKLEEKYLYSPPDPKMIQAGIRELDVLGEVNLLDSISGGDVLKWEEIKQLPYSTIFNKQMKNTIEAKINKKLVELNRHKR